MSGGTRISTRRSNSPVFERYAYPEVFFASRLPLDANFVARTSRLPSWAAGGGDAAGIRWFKSPAVAALLRQRLDRDAGTGRQYSIFRLETGGSDYQVIARFLRGASAGDSPVAVVGFFVDM